MKSASALILSLVIIGTLFGIQSVRADPTLSKQATQYANSTQYCCGRPSIGFQVNATDNLGGDAIIDIVVFEINATTNYTKLTTPAVTNNTAAVFWINFTQDQLGGKAAYGYKWYANNTTAVIAGSIQASLPGEFILAANATSSVLTPTLNATYASFNDSVKVDVSMACGASVVMTLQWKNSTNTLETKSTNLTATYSTSTKSYSYALTKTNLGETQGNVTIVNITKIYTDGGNYTALSNDTSSILNINYAKTTITVGTIKSQLIGGEDIPFAIQYKRSDDVGVSQTCTASYDGQTYPLTYNTTHHWNTTPNTEGSIGTTNTYTINCTNTSYQTKSSQGDIMTIKSGAGGGGGGGPIWPSLPKITLPSMPVWKWPTFNLPSFTWLTFNWPTFNWPKFEFPKFELPKFEFPKLW